MGMGIMRVGVEMLEVIRYRMYILGDIIGLLADFITRRCMVFTGHLVSILANIATACL